MRRSVSSPRGNVACAHSSLASSAGSLRPNCNCGNNEAKSEQPLREMRIQDTSMPAPTNGYEKIRSKSLSMMDVRFITMIKKPLFCTPSTLGYWDAPDLLTVGFRLRTSTRKVPFRWSTWPLPSIRLRSGRLIVACMLTPAQVQMGLALFSLSPTGPLSLPTSMPSSLLFTLTLLTSSV